MINTFEQYVEAPKQYLLDHPEAGSKPVYISNGYCTSEDYIRIQRAPYLKKLLGRARKENPDEVVFLL